MKSVTIPVIASDSEAVPRMGVLFRDEEAHAPLPANGKDGGGRIVSSIVPTISLSGYLILTQPPAWIIGKEYA